MKSIPSNKHVLLSGLSIVFVTTMASSVPQIESFFGPISHAVRWMPGIDSFASESSHPISLAVGMALSILAGFLVGLVIGIVRRVSLPRMSAFASLSVLQKLIHSLILLTLLMLPWFFPGTSRPHQISSPFFSIVSSNVLAISLYCSFNYLFAVASIVYISMIFRRN